MTKKSIAGKLIFKKKEDNKMMNYEEFKEIITTTIKNKAILLYPEIKIEVNTIPKNNGVTLDGLIFRDKSNVAPSVYVNYLYESYMDGKEVDGMVSEVLSMLGSELPFGSDFCADGITWENTKNNVFFQVIGEKENQERKQDVPFRNEQDLLLTYRVLVHKNEDGIASYQITNEIQEHFQVTEEMLYQAAIHNTPQLFPVLFQSMNLLMQSLMYGHDEPVDSFEKTIRALDKDEPMYVLSNNEKHYGFAVMFYPEVLEKIAQAFNCNLFILPSSIHEGILVPYAAGIETGLEELKIMVTEINCSTVLPEEKLTDQVYIYDRKLKVLMIADEWMKIQKP